MGKLLKCHLKGKASRKKANGQNIDYSEKENDPRASSAPALGLNTIIFKHVYWYMQQISGERLQDHWSSGSIQFRKIITRNRRICYNLNVMRQSACLVFNPIMVDNYTAFFNCTPVGRASDYNDLDIKRYK